MSEARSLQQPEATPAISAHRLLAFGLVCVEAATLATMSGSVVYPSLVAIVALVGCFARCSLRVSTNAKVYAYIAGLLVFGIKWWGTPMLGGAAGATLAASTPIMQFLAQYLVFAQLLDFFLVDSNAKPASPPKTRRTGWVRAPWAIPFCGVVVMACASHVVVDPRRQVLFTVFSVFFTTFYVLFYALPFRRENSGGEQTAAPAASKPAPKASLPGAISALMLITSVALGVFSAAVLNRSLSQIDTFLSSLIWPAPEVQARGFSDQARLESVREAKSTDSEKAALRVESQSEPGYLRAWAYESYDGKHWKHPQPSQTLRPLAREEVPACLRHTPDQALVYALRQAQPTGAMRIWPLAQVGDVYFLPLGATQLATRHPVVEVDTHLAASTPKREEDAQTFYDAAFASSHSLQSPSETPNSATLQRCLELPSQIDPKVRALARGLCPKDSSTQKCIGAVRAYFLGYKYHFGIQIPAGRDALSYFLLEKPAAHCEYFASGAAVLLRLMGVPCRYVTGYVAAEKNPLGGYWIARNRDAHAWVEAWDEAQSRWVVVDTTPEEGIPSGRNSSFVGALGDQSRFLLSRLGEWFHSLDLRGKLAGIPVLCWMILAGILGAAGLAAFLRKTVLRRLGRSGQSRPGRGETREVTELRAMLKKMDRRVERSLKLVRGPGETLAQFAERIEKHCADQPQGSSPPSAAAAWYRAYAALRYHPSPSQEAIAALEGRMKDEG